jgi:hypothetical protein
VLEQRASEVFHGHGRRLLTLPSIDARPGEASGPTNVATAGGMGEMFVTMGAGPRVPFGLLLRANPARIAYVADIAAYELANNPDVVLPPDSNPYGVAIVGDGSVLVTDAAANDLLRVTHDGTIELNSYCQAQAAEQSWRSSWRIAAGLASNACNSTASGVESRFGDAVPTEVHAAAMVERK